MNDHQLRYIDAQQEDITNLRDELDDFREWAIEVIHKAAEANLKLPPLPRRRPQQSTKDMRKESTP